MSGFDEGGVFYADQSNILQSEPPQAQRGLTRAKFCNFLSSYHGGADGKLIYSDALRRGQKYTKISLDDIRSYDAQLAQDVADDPAYYLPLLKDAAAEHLSSIHDLTEDRQPQDFSGLQVLLQSKNHTGPTSIRDLTSQNVSRLVVIPGIVTAASKPKHKATHVSIICKSCKAIRVLTCKPGMGGALVPRVCDANPTGPGSEGCGLDPFVTLPNRSKYVDQQTLKLQERPEDIPTGELPRTILMAVDRNLCGKIAPGTRVTAVGIFSVFTEGGKEKGSSKAAQQSIRQPYIRVVGLEEDFEGSSHYAPTFTADEEAKFKQFAANPDIYKEMYSRRIAPQIHGHENIKKAIACLLFGGARKRMPDGTNRRGDVNVLLIGDPSTAKSQFLKFASKIAPIAVYTSGKGSSAAGLTATVIRDSHGEFYLEGGAMVLADGGVVCIDEFDKMRAEDRVAIHEAMEQQTISVAKAGITTMLKSRTSVLAAANPPSGRYDDLKSAQDNIDLQTTLLSRFDLIFIVKDERNPEKDMMIARHVLATHGNAGREQQADDKAKQEEKELKRYIEYCRARCSPRLSPHAATRLVDEYVKIREDARQVNEDDSAGGAAVPITVRQLEAIVRIAESLARMQLKPVASPEHVDEAIYLFNQATVDALKSGLHEGQLVGGDSEEIMRVQEQIKSRVAIGSHVSEQRLTTEMLRLGLSEFTVQKAIHFLVAQKEFEYRRERRLLYRAMGSQH